MRYVSALWGNIKVRDGLSAYEVAVKNGFVGTEAEWLASLQGEDGAPGTNGTDGADGLSAYEIALANGFVGTEQEWLASLVGTSGADGQDGTSTYTYVAYASDNAGTNFSLTPTDLLKYRAEIHVTTELNPPTAGDFSGATWVKYIGDDGEDGGSSGGSDLPELHLDFEEAGNVFVYNVPYAMKFTSMVCEGTDATLDVPLNTNLARYDRLTITATAGGLVSLYGVYI